jgi:HlyD family secretion protein
MTTEKNTPATDGGSAAAPERIAPPPPARVPAVVPPARAQGGKPRWRRNVMLLIVVLAAALGGAYWWHRSATALPPGIAFGNGRLEADEIDIDTKFAGRIGKLFADEGDMVKGGQVVALMDTRDLEASLGKAQAGANQAHRALEAAKSNLTQQESQLTLAKQELDRTASLVPRGFATVELLDQRKHQMNAAAASRDAAAAKVGEAEHGLDAARHDVELYRVNIVDNALTAPRDGRIEYRVANVGEVLAAGGKVFTMLDTGYVYMDIYLPTADAGRVRLGSDARIVLDAYADRPIPAKVVYLASQAQFTPKTVETKDERDKLMFRLRLRIDPDRLEGRAELVRSGLPGIAYVRTDPAAAWPPQLQGSPAS